LKKTQKYQHSAKKLISLTEQGAKLNNVVVAAVLPQTATL
jgi:hypothetical protein